MIEDIMSRTKQRRKEDAQRFEEHDEDLCMLCGAYGPDKRSLFISCFYAIEEVVPEAIDLAEVEGIDYPGYYLLICKTCRAELLGQLEKWRKKRVARRTYPKDSDGYEDNLPYGMIPVRVNGITVMMTQEQLNEHRKKNK